ncbi:MAG: sialidase family protein [Candidatus Limnocylindrales bacterium]
MQARRSMGRLRALVAAAALVSGALAVPGAAIQASTPDLANAQAGHTGGWVGEKQYDASAPDDWEPAIAADPHSPYVYALATRYGTEPPCPVDCPSPFIVLRVSHDGGASWGPVHPLCACTGAGQFDPLIEVVPATGVVYATFMRDDFVVFMKSTDHGAHWSAPADTHGQAAWTDKPAMAMSDSGRDVYVSWNGPSDGDPYVAQSHDYGATWKQTKLVDSARYFYAFDADVAPDGTVYFSESSLDYQPPLSNTPVGNVEHHVFISRDHGKHWEDHLVAVVKVGLVCGGSDCRDDFWIGHSALSADGRGNLVLLYDGARTEGGLQTISVRRSTDEGKHWSGVTTLSTSGEEATSPAVESRGNGDVRAWWMETSGANIDRWNVWYRSSTDGGAHWSAKVKLSDRTGGASYKKKGGFLQVYGDYGEIAITNAGKTIAIWGEGSSYLGPGGIWYNRQN